MQNPSPSSSLHAGGMGRTTSSDGLAAARLSPVHAVNGVAASAACTSWHETMRPFIFTEHCITAHISWPLHVGDSVKQCTAAVSATCMCVSISMQLCMHFHYQLHCSLTLHALEIPHVWPGCGGNRQVVPGPCHRARRDRRAGNRQSASAGPAAR